MHAIAEALTDVFLTTYLVLMLWLNLRYLRDLREERRLLLPRDCFDTRPPPRLPVARVRKKKRRLRGQ
jgi:hypothetical protein